MYTEATGNTATYTQINPDKSIWDGGATQWDFNGNVYASPWDDVKTAYSESVGGASSYAEAVGASASYLEASGGSAVYREVIEAGSVWDSGNTIWDVTGNIELTLWDI